MERVRDIKCREGYRREREGERWRERERESGVIAMCYSLERRCLSRRIYGTRFNKYVVTWRVV